MGGRRLLRLMLAAGLVATVALLGPSLGLFRRPLLAEQGTGGPVYDLAGAWSVAAEVQGANAIQRIRVARGWSLTAVAVRSASEVATHDVAGELADQALRERDRAAVPDVVIVLLLPASGERGIAAVRTDEALARAGFDGEWTERLVTVVGTRAADGALDDALRSGIDLVGTAQVIPGAPDDGRGVLVVFVIGAALWGLAIALILFALREDHRRGWHFLVDRRPPWMR